MSIISARTGDLASGIALRTTLDGEFIRSYVVVSPPDLNVIADIVPREEVEAGGEIHATAVSDPVSAAAQVGDVLDNINPGDIAVFLCADAAAYEAALQLLGYDPARHDTELH
ncbi:hypothetical protein [Bordetella bronchialis]|uniref:Uncharacterized protein n=1 Tax=Bordetella bronchialis TaxID=463025 RepID=A0A193G5X2_9BORD|nr:hypothetical protein [Bordetella bronchialis]ANN69718.1 hypothetical protein BAU06_16645 [Bordetella bronchialis]ANN74861.1 hypothetical protein BAU08_16890 [Bordetella bronchialis]